MGQVVFETWDRQWKKEKASEQELLRQRNNQPKAGLISIVVPVYNTKASFLKALLESMQAQSYEEYAQAASASHAMEVMQGLRNN